MSYGTLFFPVLIILEK